MACFQNVMGYTIFNPINFPVCLSKFQHKVHYQKISLIWTVPLVYPTNNFKIDKSVLQSINPYMHGDIPIDGEEEEKE